MFVHATNCLRARESGYSGASSHADGDTDSGAQMVTLGIGNRIVSAGSGGVLSARGAGEKGSIGGKLETILKKKKK